MERWKTVSGKPLFGEDLAKQWSATEVPRAVRRPPQISPTPFTTRSPSLRCRALIGMDFAANCPLVRSWRLIKRFLFIDPWFCYALPPDATSRSRPCASLSFAPIGLD
jgi:hypothetical protein